MCFRIILTIVLSLICNMSFSQVLEVVGSIKIIDGNQGQNKDLTSDIDGIETWETIFGLLPTNPIEGDMAYYTGLS